MNEAIVPQKLLLYILGRKIKSLHRTLGEIAGVFFILFLSQPPSSLFLYFSFFLLFSPDSVPLKDSFLYVPLSLYLWVFALTVPILGIAFFYL